jgi:formylglycine-generating enzyme required for sulfatase activity
MDQHSTDTLLVTPATRSMSDIFISYASHDRDRIRPLAEALEAHGWSVFWDATLLPGETWRRKISKELEAARCVIVMWSERSVESQWVEQEAEEGQRRGILVPAFIDRVTIPLGFRGLQAANLVGWNGAPEHREFVKMLRAIVMHAALAASAAAPPGRVASITPTPVQQEDNLVSIPAGAFWMGAQRTDKNGRNYYSQAFDNESRVRQVTLKSFRMARFSVTVKEFSHFIISAGYQIEKHWGGGGFSATNEPENWAEQQKNPGWPVVGVNWFEASAYCAWAGLRLPTEAEWERVARGPKSARYPWGNEPPLDESRANYNGSVGHPTPEGLYPNGRSAEAIQDLLGNVWEWCSDWFDGYAEGTAKVVRGGSWRVVPESVHVSVRTGVGPRFRNDNFGFRCAGELR